MMDDEPGTLKPLLNYVNFINVNVFIHTII